MPASPFTLRRAAALAGLILMLPAAAIDSAALATAAEPERRAIVARLAAMGRPGGSPVIRDPAIIRALVEGGYARDDQARADAQTILLAYAEPASLAAFQQLFLRSLKNGEGHYLMLAAKAKTTAARPLVERLARAPGWRDDPAIAIAQAALGNTAVEERLLAAVRNAEHNLPPVPASRFSRNEGVKDASALLEQVRVLGLAGTPRSLRLACQYLRSPLQANRTGVYERSIRREALAALQVNYPAAAALAPPAGIEGWREAEQFCSRTLGVMYRGPTPELDTDRAYPMMQNGH